MLPWTSFSLIQGRGFFQGKDHRNEIQGGKSLRKGWRQWDMWPKSREQCRTDQDTGQLMQERPERWGRGCGVQGVRCHLAYATVSTCSVLLCHWAWVRGNCRWGYLCKDILYIVARNHLWSQQYLSKSTELCYRKAVAEDKCGNVFLSIFDQWWSSRRKVGWGGIHHRYRRGEKRDEKERGRLLQIFA